MKLRILLIGKIKNSSLKKEIKDLSKRISRFEFIELNEIKQSNEELLKQKEYESFLPYLKETSWTSYLLTERGEEFTSKGFYQELKSQEKVQFLISGAYGPSEKLRKEVKKHLSLSQMIFTHEQAAYLLVEQLYRVECFSKNIPYTK